jgi:hypothetical protein
VASASICGLTNAEADERVSELRAAAPRSYSFVRSLAGALGDSELVLRHRASFC